MLAKVHITLKTGVLDPQGKAIEHALAALDFNGVDQVRQGKYIEIDLSEERNETDARAHVQEMCKHLLANTVIENFEIEIVA